MYPLDSSLACSLELRTDLITCGLVAKDEHRCRCHRYLVLMRRRLCETKTLTWCFVSTLTGSKQSRIWTVVFIAKMYVHGETPYMVVLILKNLCLVIILGGFAHCVRLMQLII
ncbi:hypothetical protein BT96DRAFT_456760 [Gymnopus androsaceus JB14]|uniref:Uncharacterized protein n=1 Tax=Gymnopus androsaceus JB14 TaxID=1447944 RepID=A0A6A4GRH0_9AGAR|nr:hypothetical protein BT96DRAFT_456760 [Gymnopus androsaceus JB14]